MTNRHELINYLIKFYSFNSYLEIGYKAGGTFDRIICNEKTAIDPCPQKNCPELLFMTSNEFFRTNAIASTPKTFDIVFIDGLHEYPQVKRDFENSLKYLSPKGIIVFHDMNPQDTKCADGKIIPGEVRARPFSEGGCYNGDCYKLAIDIYNGEYPYCYITADMDEGCMVVYNGTKREIKINTVVEKNYTDFDKNREKVLNLTQL